jgi:hypothetical protein
MSDQLTLVTFISDLKHRPAFSCLRASEAYCYECPSLAFGCSDLDSRIHSQELTPLGCAGTPRHSPPLVVIQKCTVCLRSLSDHVFKRAVLFLVVLSMSAKRAASSQLQVLSSTSSRLVVIPVRRLAAPPESPREPACPTVISVRPPCARSEDSKALVMVGLLSFVSFPQLCLSAAARGAHTSYASDG